MERCAKLCSPYVHTFFHLFLVEWLTVSCPGMRSPLCYFLFNIQVIFNFARFPVCNLMFKPIKAYVIISLFSFSLLVHCYSCTNREHAGSSAAFPPAPHCCLKKRTFAHFKIYPQFSFYCFNKKYIYIFYRN